MRINLRVNFKSGSTLSTTIPKCKLIDFIIRNIFNYYSNKFGPVESIGVE